MPTPRRYASITEVFSISFATAMSLAVASAFGLPTRLAARASPSRRASADLLFSRSSLFAPNASARPPIHQAQRTFYSPPTCPVNRNTCPSLSGSRSFHSSAHNWISVPQFTYHVAASYSAKGPQFNAERDLFTGDVFDPNESNAAGLSECKASKDKRRRANSGQDAFFYSQVGTTQTRTFGVADGVGGWVDSGVDPADFSHGLCEYMACAARLRPQGAKTNPLHPKDLLQVGYDAVINDDGIVGGGSTACLAVAEPDGNLEVANLGDSGFMHLGLNAVRHFTHPQTHAFNTPYQLSKTPQRMLVQMAVFGGPSTLSDLPKESSVTHHRVRHGDVLVFATDGVWDNIGPQDALSIVSRRMVDLGAWVEKDGAVEVGQDLAQLVQARSGRRADGQSLQARLAVAIAREAKKTSLDTRRDGRFAKEVQKHYPNENWHGGKPDDIAALVAVVVESPAS